MTLVVTEQFCVNCDGMVDEVDLRVDEPTCPACGGVDLFDDETEAAEIMSERAAELCMPWNWR